MSKVRIKDHYRDREVMVAPCEVAETLAPWYVDSAADPAVIADRLRRLQESYVTGEPNRHLEAVLGLDVNDVRESGGKVTWAEVDAADRAAEARLRAEHLDWLRVKAGRILDAGGSRNKALHHVASELFFYDARRPSLPDLFADLTDYPRAMLAAEPVVRLAERDRTWWRRLAPDRWPKEGGALMSNAAQAAIFAAVQYAGAFVDGQLTISHPHRRETVEELVRLMSDVEVEEWASAYEDYRSYRGRLRSGLRLDVITIADQVEPIDIES
jgi:hypothetical protein